jgi:hypothetical protein
MRTTLGWIAAAAALLGAGCGGFDPDPGPVAPVIRHGEVDYSATTAIMESFPVQLSTTVMMTNPSSTATTVRLGSGCPVQIRVYRDTGRTALAWDQGRVIACTQEIQIVDLAGRGRAERNARASARDILGDSLPDGHYFLGAYVQVLDTPFVVPAGEADLAVPR